MADGDDVKLNKEAIAAEVSSEVDEKLAEEIEKKKKSIGSSVKETLGKVGIDVDIQEKESSVVVEIPISADIDREELANKLYAEKLEQARKAAEEEAERRAAEEIAKRQREIEQEAMRKAEEAARKAAEEAARKAAEEAAAKKAAEEAARKAAEEAARKAAEEEAARKAAEEAAARKAAEEAARKAAEEAAAKKAAEEAAARKAAEEAARKATEEEAARKAAEEAAARKAAEEAARKAAEEEKARKTAANAQREKRVREIAQKAKEEKKASVKERPAKTAEGDKFIPNLKRRYLTQVRDKLQKEFGFSSPMQIPRMTKITVSFGCKEDKENGKKYMDAAVKELEQITGQHVVRTKARKSIANFHVRQGQEIGAMVTLRNDNMWYFLERLICIALPRVRDFRGVKPNAFDGHGNYSLGITEQIIFPEIDFDKIERISGFNIAFVTTAKNDKEGYALLRELGMPFSK